MRLYVVCAVSVVAIGLAARAQVADRSAPRARADVASERVLLARQAIAALERGQNFGERPADDARLTLWYRRLAETYRALDPRSAAARAAIRSYLDRARRVAAIAAQKHRVGEASLSDLHEAQYQALEAESWSAEAEGK